MTFERLHKWDLEKMHVGDQVGISGRYLTYSPS